MSFPAGLQVRASAMKPTDVVLRIVRSSDVIGHEEVDPKRIEVLARRLQVDGVLKNPPVVVEAGQRYVLLDGATRLAALRKLGIRDVLVQIVDYHAPSIHLYAWCHVVVDVPREDLLEGLEALEGLDVKPIELDLARRALSLRTILCYLVLRDGTVLGAKGGMRLEAQVALLNDVVNLYRGQAGVYRVTTDEVESLLEEYPELTAVVVFPSYSRGEIMRTSLDGAKLPMGVTRHTISGRALGLNVDVAMLDSDIPLDQKNIWLQSLIKRKIRQDQVRFYPEPVMRFDE